MAHCFMTGVQFQLEEGFVLNRRGAHDFLNALKNRAASLQHIIDQLSPLDVEEKRAATHWRVPDFAPKKHRLVCKAMADGLSLGFPEIKLFLSWPDYYLHSRLRLDAIRGRPNAVVTSPDGLDAAPTLPDVGVYPGSPEPRAESVRVDHEKKSHKLFQKTFCFALLSSSARTLIRGQNQCEAHWYPFVPVDFRRALLPFGSHFYEL